MYANKRPVVALYARVSTDKQTTDNQMIRLKDFASSRGYDVYDEYTDVASGKLTRRPALDRMLADAKSHKFDKIIAVKIDRIGRSLVNLKNIVDKLVSWDVGLEMLDQEIDTSSPSGRLMISLLGAFAEYEREMIVERTNDGIARARKEGKILGHPKTELSRYQIDKAEKLIEDNPNISQRELASYFEGIDRKTLIRLLKEQGIFVGGEKRVSERVYKESPKKSMELQTSDCNPTIEGAIE